MNQVTAWALIVGFLTPLVVSTINQPRWSATQKRVMAVVVAVVVGLGNVFVQGLIVDWTLSFGNVLIILATVLGAAQAAYALLWEPTGIAEKVETATSSRDSNLAA